MGENGQVGKQKARFYAGLWMWLDAVGCCDGGSARTWTVDQGIM